MRWLESRRLRIVGGSLGRRWVRWVLQMLNSLVCEVFHALFSQPPALRYWEMILFWEGVVVVSSVHALKPMIVHTLRQAHPTMFGMLSCLKEGTVSVRREVSPC